MVGGGPQNLVVPGRKFVKQGSLVVWSVKQKKRQPSLIFLFSDLLVTTKWSGTRPFLCCHHQSVTLRLVSERDGYPEAEKALVGGEGPQISGLLPTQVPGPLLRPGRHK